MDQAGVNDEAYRIEIVQVGKMDEAPTCAVYALEKIGEYEPFCYTMLILRRERDSEVIVINTGFPEELSLIRKAWKDWDARCLFERTDDMKVANILAARSIDPLSINQTVADAPSARQRAVMVSVRSYVLSCAKRC